MKGGDGRGLLHAAIAAVRDCAAQMESQAESLLRAFPSVAIEAGLRASVLETCGALKDTAGRVTFELALLQTQLDEDKVDGGAAVRTLSALDASMMGALAGMAEVVDQLENAAERDETNEPAFVLVIEATGVMLAGLETAKVATQGLREAMATAART
jgi:hypothetical protein